MTSSSLDFLHEDATLDQAVALDQATTPESIVHAPRDVVALLMIRSVVKQKCDISSEGKLPKRM